MATASPSDPAAAARVAEVARTTAEVLTLADRREPSLGAGRLVCVDGPAGSGKTTLGAAVAAAAGAPLLHMDDLYDGWSGLAAGIDQLAGLIDALARDGRGTYRRYDWHRGSYAETVEVAAVPLLVVEGVGAAAEAAVRGRATVRVWLEADDELRLRRGLARDGLDLAPHWRAWMTAEAEHFARDRTRERADVVVDTTDRPPGSAGTAGS